jgi:hypothetical protein
MGSGSSFRHMVSMTNYFEIILRFILFVLPLDIASRMRPILRFYDPRVNKLTYPRTRDEVCELVSYAAALAVNTSCIPDLIQDALDGNEKLSPEYRLCHAMALSAAFSYAAKNGKADEFARSANLANEDLVTSTSQVIQLLGQGGAAYIANKFYKYARVALVIARSDFYTQRRKELAAGFCSSCV